MLYQMLKFVNHLNESMISVGRDGKCQKKGLSIKHIEKKQTKQIFVLSTHIILGTTIDTDVYSAII